MNCAYFTKGLCTYIHKYILIWWIHKYSVHCIITLHGTEARLHSTGGTNVYQIIDDRIILFFIGVWLFRIMLSTAFMISFYVHLFAKNNYIRSLLFWNGKIGWIYLVLVSFVEWSDLYWKTAGAFKCTFVVIKVDLPLSKSDCWSIVLIWNYEKVPDVYSYTILLVNVQQTR